MAREFAKQFYKSSAWLKCRASYIKSVHHLCERCGESGYIVHHKVYISPDNINNPEVTLNHDNLEYLCQTCHNKEHMGGGVVARGLMFDDNGKLIPISYKGK